MIMSNIGYIINEGFGEPYPVKIIKEDTNFNGKTVAEGILQNANEKNRNGRWYDEEELFPQISCPRTVELLNAGYLRSENGHPLDKSLARQSTIDDKLTNARFLKLWTEGTAVWGRFVGTNNEYGRAFDMDLKEGCLPAWSLRALGTIQQTNRGAEVKNLRLITYDQVIYPSHPGAYTQRIVSEAVDESAAMDSALENDIKGEPLLFPVNNKDVISYIKTESANLRFIQEYFDFVYSDIKIGNNGTKVILTENNGNVIVVPLERHIHNEFMTYATDIVNSFWSEEQ